METRPTTDIELSIGDSAGAIARRTAAAAASEREAPRASSTSTLSRLAASSSSTVESPTEMPALAWGRGGRGRRGRGGGGGGGDGGVRLQRRLKTGGMGENK